MESHLGNPLMISKHSKQTKEYKEEEIKVANRNEDLVIPELISPYQEKW